MRHLRARRGTCVLQRHLGAWPRDTPMYSARHDLLLHPFNVTSALGRGILAVDQTGMGEAVVPSTSPRRLAEGYREIGASSGFESASFNVTSALGRGILCSRTCSRSGQPPFNVTSALGRGIRRRSRRGRPSPIPFNVTSALGRGIRLPTPRRSPLAKTFNVTSALGRGIPRMTSAIVWCTGSLQRHLGAWPRDTASCSVRRWPTCSLQRHLGAWPRDTAASQAVDSRRIFPPISRASPFLALHAFRRIGRGRASR